MDLAVCLEIPADLVLAWLPAALMVPSDKLVLFRMELVPVELASIVMVMAVILLPLSNSDQLLYGNRNAISSAAASGSRMTILCESERSLNDSPFS